MPTNTHIPEPIRPRWPHAVIAAAVAVAAILTLWFAVHAGNETPEPQIEAGTSFELAGSAH